MTFCLLILMPWTPEFNSIFWNLSHSQEKNIITVNLPLLILIGDPRSRGGVNLPKPFFYLKIKYIYYWTQVSKAWVINRQKVLLGVNHSFKTRILLSKIKKNSPGGACPRTPLRSLEFIFKMWPYQCQNQSYALDSNEYFLHKFNEVDPMIRFSIYGWNT